MEGLTSTLLCNEIKQSPDSGVSSQSENVVTTSDEAKPLKLSSPAGGEQLRFIYSVPNTEFVDILKYDCVLSILNNFIHRLALEEFDGLRAVVNKSIDVCLDDLYNAE